MHFKWMVAAICTGVVAEEEARWVPDCGDTVGMLGPQISSAFTSLNKNVSDINLIYAYSTYTVPTTASIPTIFSWKTMSGSVRLVKIMTPSDMRTCTSQLTTTVTDFRSDEIALTTAAAASFTSTGNVHAPMTLQTSTPAILSLDRYPSLTAPPSSTPTGFGIRTCYVDGGAVTNTLQILRAALKFCDAAYSYQPSLIPGAGYTLTTSTDDIMAVLGISNTGCDGAVEVLSHESSPVDDPSHYVHNRAVWKCFTAMTSIWRDCKCHTNTKPGVSDTQSAGKTMSNNSGRGGLAVVECQEFDFRLSKQSSVD